MPKTTPHNDYMNGPYSDDHLVEMLVRNDGVKRKDAVVSVQKMSLSAKMSAVSDQLMRYGNGAAILEHYKSVGAQIERQENAVVVH